MPAPARISVPVKQATPLKPSPGSTSKTPASIPRPKARVVHRRRARGRLDDTESDDDLVREPHSDSGSDSATSTLDTESESDSEADDQNDARVPSPSHTPLVNGELSSPTPPSPVKVPAFPPTLDWSDMVADENANGAAALPVIDFADLSSHARPTSPPPVATVSPPSPLAEPAETESSRRAHATGSSPAAARQPGQSARQAYLTRLDNDPAYVPTLGQFWSHDDRLLDKDLRSLSGWWRGRWQGRGRARGRVGFAGGWPMRGGARGRGGFVNGGPGSPFPAEDTPPEEEAAPVDRAWTHDGFEEMKKVEEEKRQQFQFRARGAFPRGRGGFRGGFAGRGGFASAQRASSPHDSLARPQSESQQSSTSDTLRFGNGTRPWFAMKPERVWTKQFDGYLHFEAQLKPVHNQGLGQGVRIKLPGKKEKGTDADADAEDAEREIVVVRLPQRTAGPPKPAPPPVKEPLPERAFVVNLPSRKRAGKERAAVTVAPEDVTTGAPPPMDDTVPPLRAAPALPVQRRLTQDAPAFTPSRASFPPARRASDVVVSIPHASTGANASVEQSAEAPSPQLRRHTSDESSASFAGAGPSQPSAQEAQSVEAARAHAQPPVLPPLQTVVPPFQATPPYGSPYGYTPPGLPLPPGIAVSESGVTYEIATGRAVYLHTPPPPAPPPQMQVPMYNPRPMPMHHAHHGSVHFLPHHGHTPSMSLSVSPPAFLSSPPIFALPRQTNRIEIRAPGEKGKEREGELEPPSSGSRPTGLGSAVNVNAEPFTPAAHMQSQPMGYYPPEAQQQAFDESQRHHQHHPSMSYQPGPYYYPVGPEGGTPYGYGQQYAGADAGQPQQYDTYAQDTYPQQHAVYY